MQYFFKNYLNMSSQILLQQSHAKWITAFLWLLPIVGIIITTLFGSLSHSLLFILCYCFLILLFFKLDLVILFFLMFIPIMRLPGRLTLSIEDLKYIIGLIILLAWFAKKLISLEAPLYIKLKNPFNLFIVVFSMLAIISTIYSTDVKCSFEMLAKRILFIFAFFYFFMDIIRGKKHIINRIIIALLVTGGAVGLLAILQYVIVQFQVLQGLKRFIVPISQQGYIPLSEEGVFKIGAYRSVGPFLHPNLLGLYLAMLLPIAVSLFIYGNKNKRWYLSIPILFMLGGLFVSGSRGAFLDFLIAISLLFIINRKNKIMLLFTALIVLICLLPFFICPEITKEFLRLQDESGFSFRKSIWVNALDIFKRHPLHGWGLGTFSYNYISQYGMVTIEDLERVLNEMILVTRPEDWKGFLQGGFAAHNIYIGYGVEMGFLGIISILCFYFIYFKRAFYLLNKVIDRYSKALLGGFAAVVLGNMVHGFFEYPIVFGPTATSITFFLIIAMTVSLEQSDSYIISNNRMGV